MQFFPYWRVLTAAVCLLLALPAWSAEDAADASWPSAAVEDAGGIGDARL